MKVEKGSHIQDAVYRIEIDATDFNLLGGSRVIREEMLFNKKGYAVTLKKC